MLSISRQLQKSTPTIIEGGKRMPFATYDQLSMIYFIEYFNVWIIWYLASIVGFKS